MPPPGRPIPLVERAPTAADLDVEGQLVLLQGTFAVRGRVATVAIEMIERHPDMRLNLLKIVHRLMDLAREAGAAERWIVGSMANPKLDAVMRARYTVQSADSFVIPLE